MSDENLEEVERDDTNSHWVWLWEKSRGKLPWKTLARLFEKRDPIPDEYIGGAVEGPNLEWFKDMVTRHDERFGWIAERFKTLDASIKTITEDVGAIRESQSKIEPALKGVISALRSFEKRQVELGRLFQSHVSAKHLTKEEARQIAEWVHRTEEEKAADIALKEQGIELGKAQWVRDHKVEVFSAGVVAVNLIVVVLFQII